MGSSGVSMTPIVKVAVPAPIPTLFDYLPPPPEKDAKLQVGVRVKVPFGRGGRIGVVMGLEQASEVAPERLKPVMEILDHKPLFSRNDLDFLRWTAHYYHHPLGEVLATALPAMLRQGKAAKVRGLEQLRLTPLAGEDALPSRAKRQLALLKLLQENDGVMTTAALSTLDWDWRAAARSLEKKRLLTVETLSPSPARPSPGGFKPNAAQRSAIEAIKAGLDDFSAFLLEGVTGSGKTEVYLGAAEAVLRRQRQLLVLLPEIALTPQLQARFHKRLGCPIGIYHSGLGDTERLNAWIGFKEGKLPILLGTRSAIFVPMARPGLIVVDEEHDPSFKQQEGLRFSARDLAVVRARMTGIPVILGSATPSLESLHNARRNRYLRLPLPERAGSANPPTVQRLDLRNQKLLAGLSPRARSEIEQALARQEQILIFLNRRGFAPILICHGCGWTADCPRCDARLVLHHFDGRLRCHHCGHETLPPSLCPGCGESKALIPLGQGTERIENELAQAFPQARVARIDRDTTRRKGSLQRILDQVRSGDTDILLGTQMLAKGHDFPNVTLVVILDADAGLYSTDFRAPERMAQLITQVAGRAGRGIKPGRVLIQTRHPDHPLLTILLDRGYRAFAEQALEERRQAELPPFSFQALLRAEALQPEPPCAFLQEAAHSAHALGLETVAVLGPVPAPMPKRAGHYRYQLLLQSRERASLHRLLARLLPDLRQLPRQRKIRWSLDVDPADLY